MRYTNLCVCVCVCVCVSTRSVRHWSGRLVILFADDERQQTFSPRYRLGVGSGSVLRLRRLVLFRRLTAPTINKCRLKVTNLLFNQISAFSALTLLVGL